MRSQVLVLSFWIWDLSFFHFTSLVKSELMSLTFWLCFLFCNSIVDITPVNTELSLRSAVSLELLICWADPEQEHYDVLGPGRKTSWEKIKEKSKQRIESDSVWLFRRKLSSCNRSHATPAALHDVEWTI